MRSTPGGICSTIAHNQAVPANDPHSQAEEHSRVDQLSGLSTHNAGKAQWLDGYSHMITDRVREGWSPYLLTVMFTQLPGPRHVVIDHMRDALHRLYSQLVTRVHRKPRTAASDELPVLIGVFDLPVYKRDRSSSPLVPCNGGVHFHAVVLVPPTSRLRGSLVDHMAEHTDLYVNGRVQRIDVRPVTDRHEWLTDYVFKTVKKGRISYDDAMLVLPRSRSELEAETTHQA